MLENAATPLTHSTAKKLALFYKVDVDWLLTGQASPLKAAQERFQKEIKASGLDADAETAIEEIATWLRHLVTGNESMQKPALTRIQAIAEGFAAQCTKRNKPIRQASLEIAHIINSKTIIDYLDETDTSSDMSELWPSLLERTKNCLQNNSQYSLAKHLGISRQAVHAYIAGASAPSAEKTLQLLKWVEEMEGKEKSGSAGAATPTEARTRTKKTRKDELSSDPPKP